VKLDDMRVEVVSWRVTARGGDTDRHANVDLAKVATGPKSTRAVFLDGQSLDVPIYDRHALAANQVIEGPVIVEERETTVFVLPGWTLNVHEDGSLIARRDTV
jgi:N-methylhydantoinase A